MVENVINKETAEKAHQWTYIDGIKSTYDISGPEKIELNFSKVSYSNEQFMLCTGRDMYIDFLELPGINIEGVHKIDATRIFLTPDIARNLANNILRSLEPLQQPVNK